MLLLALALTALWTAKPAAPASASSATALFTSVLPASVSWSWPWLPPAASFRPATREVNIWRREAALALDLSPGLTAALLWGEDLRAPPRCIKLNNYWCIKRAGWIGEIAADGEGHVAFASAREGAATAALLLRRYYVNFGLKTARAITARWAPAQCGGGAVASSGVGARSIAGGGIGARSVAGGGVPLGGLTRFGLGGTVRAKWLATHTVGGLPRGAALAGKSREGGAPASARPKEPSPLASVRPKGPSAPVAASIKEAGSGSKPSRATVSLRRPPPVERGLDPSLVIMAGAGAPVTERLALLPFAGIPMGPAPGSKVALPPLSTCAGESARVATYAAKASQGVAEPDADLQLFDAAGKPTANLAKVMRNMAAVEIGPYRASDAVITAGVADLAARLK